MAKADKKLKLSLCMIAKNEEEDLPRCLEAAKPFVDEIIVVDTGSTDKTVEIAKKYTKNVFHFKWINDFSAARNESLKHATGNWVLILDADETISPEDFKRVRELMEFEDVDGYALIQRNYRHQSLLYVTNATDPKDPYAHGMPCFDDNKIIRLFRRKKEISFVYQVHEAVGPSLKKIGYKVQPTNIIIHHYNKALVNPEIREYKDDFYLKIGLDEIKKNPKDDKPLFEVGVYYFNHGELTKAIDYFAKAHALNPDLKLVSFYLAVAYEMSGQNDLAVEHYEKSLDSPHNTTMPYVNLANLYLKLNRFKDAADLCQQGLEKNPGNFPLYNTLGFLHLTHKNYDSAEQALQQGLLFSPNFTNPFTIKTVNNLAIAYITQEKYKEATTLLLNQIRLNSHVPDYYHNLVQVYNAQKAYAQSLAVIEKALKNLTDLASQKDFKSLLQETKKMDLATKKNNKENKKVTQKFPH
ncbi:MAG TPA: glycosyltransferase [Candidatus Nanoarchaeia archaeon]|nr:glycosyltransferase [Candidatus Nanoarchaeia archaeon]